MKKQLFDAEFVVPRESREEHTFAIVKARVETSDLKQCGTFLAALRRAVKAWVLETKEGRAAWGRSCCDMNIGDLSSEGITSALGNRLRKQGIYSMKTEIYGSSAVGSWSFDSVLAEDVEDEE
jgi:hypothetical protein